MTLIWVIRGYSESVSKIMLLLESNGNISIKMSVFLSLLWC